jgi:hypothetical protein
MIAKVGILIALSLGASAIAAGSEAPANSNEELKRQIDVLGSEIQKLKLGGAAEAQADQSQYGFGPAASKVYRTDHGFSIGGYGEILFERFLGGFNADGTPAAGYRIAPHSGGVGSGASARQSRIDLKRLILYAGYKFNEEWVLNSELEWEHGGEELAVEFLYFDRFVKSELNYRFGKVLMPMGLTNETHEPVTFLGSHRPLVETLIIPSTWTEYGAGIFGDLGKEWTYRTYVVTGMNASGFSEVTGIREGRNERDLSSAARFAWTGRLDYVGKPGLLAGVSSYIGEASTEAKSNQPIVSVPMKLFEAHAHYTVNAWDFRVLGAYTFLSNVDQLNSLLTITPGSNTSVGSEQVGAYGQVGYDVLNGTGSSASLTPFVRYEIVNLQKAVPTGWASSDQNLIHETVVGLNYKPISQIVLKADYEWFKIAQNQGVDQVNLSVGYVF